MTDQPIHAKSTLPGNVSMEFLVTDDSDPLAPQITLTLSGEASAVEALFTEKAAIIVTAHLLAGALPPELLEILPQEIRDTLGL